MAEGKDQFVGKILNSSRNGSPDSESGRNAGNVHRILDVQVQCEDKNEESDEHNCSPCSQINAAKTKPKEKEDMPLYVLF